MATAGLVVLVVHWFCILVSITGPNRIRQKLSPAVDLYAGALFYQKWRLFAPDPATYSKKLWYRCRFGPTTWSPWRSPVDELLEEHYRKRVTYHGKLLRIPTTFVVGLGQAAAKNARELPCARGDAECIRKRDEHFKTTPIHRAAMKFTIDHCREGFPTIRQPLTAAQFKLELVNVNDAAEREDSNGRPARSKYEFDPFEVRLEH